MATLSVAELLEENEKEAVEKQTDPLNKVRLMDFCRQTLRAGQQLHPLHKVHKGDLHSGDLHTGCVICVLHVFHPPGLGEGPL